MYILSGRHPSNISPNELDVFHLDLYELTDPGPVAT